MKLDAMLFDRFWSHVDKRADGCWVWRGGRPHVQPSFMVGRHDDGREIGSKVGRVAWAFNQHDWELPPDDYFISQTCGNKHCVRFEHLQLKPDWMITRAAIAAQKKPTRESDVARFMAGVSKNENGCWNWIGARSGATGYGYMWFDQRQLLAHRVSHLLFKGPLDSTKVVMHSCDDRSCVNPDHLSQGTHRENIHDARQKGRLKRATAKLTIAQVASIKAEYTKRDGEMARLANKYNVTITAIYSIMTGITWKDVAPADPATVEIVVGEVSQRRRGEQHPRSKITEAIVRQIRELRETKLSTIDDLAKIFELDRTTVWAIIKRKSWRHVV